MHGKIISGIICGTLAFSAIAPFTVFAHEETDASRETLRQRIEERKDELLQKADEQRAALNEQKKQALRRYFENMRRRLDVLTRNLERFASRIETLINKFEEKGKDVTAARIKLAEARTEILDVADAKELLVDSFETMLETENPREAFADVREAVQNLKRELREAHLALVQVLRELKGASGRTAPEPAEETETEEQTSE